MMRVTRNHTQNTLKQDVIVAAAFGAALVFTLVATRTQAGEPFISIPRLLIAMSAVAGSLAFLVGTRDQPIHAPQRSRARRLLVCACWGAVRGAIIGFYLGVAKSVKPVGAYRLHLATRQDQVMFLLMLVAAGLVVGFTIGLYSGAKSNEQPNN